MLRPRKSGSSGRWMSRSDREGGLDPYPCMIQLRPSLDELRRVNNRRRKTETEVEPKAWKWMCNRKRNARVSYQEDVGSIGHDCRHGVIASNSRVGNIEQFS
ncbi:hypothetical protein BS47DRAFT_854272 [Hydnum rufescens UP504]|uniref:Uncharacterized protein n=1 Tax=Hydnum rufescens UP504 TaxID=1448309 RepID=A0A9P6B9H6_9AGAM|nr:hypothetical protein BS47DRAFT_854272 [Hydnum rufescens UP504]